MLDQLITWLLQRHLKPFVEDTGNQSLASLRDGRLLLQDVSLSPSLLASLALPLAVKAISIARLEILLPWRQSGTSLPLVISLDGVRVILAPLDESGPDRLHSWLVRLKRQRLEASSGAPAAAAAEAEEEEAAAEAAAEAEAAEGAPPALF